MLPFFDMDEIRNKIKDRLVIAATRLMNLSKEELQKQGHRASGKLEDSFKVIVPEATLSKIIVQVIAEDYGLVLDHGVPASRVPYTSGGARSGGHSKYIEGLLRWAMIVKPTLGEKERKSFVFAVARKASKEGHPTSGSLYLSSTGKRKGWINDAVLGKDKEILEHLDLDQLIKKDIEDAIAVMQLPHVTIKRG